MEYHQHVTRRMVVWFQHHNYSQWEGECYLRTYPIDTLEKMFGITSPA